MEVEDEIMYHYHRPGNYDSLWQEGKEIEVGDNFVSGLWKTILNFNTSVLCDEGKLVTFDRVIANHLANKVDDKEILLECAHGFIYDANLFKRELALEECRRKRFSHLPSRKSSIWVADAKGIGYWQNTLKVERGSIFKVALTGNLFKSSDKFLPSEELTYGESLVSAHNYWNPIFESEEAHEQTEYLFQGKVKVLERI